MTVGRTASPARLPVVHPDRNRPLTIGIVTPPWLPVPPPGYGGTENVVASLVRGLEAAGHEVVLFATGDSAAGHRVLWCYEEAFGEVGLPAAEALQVATAYEALRDVELIHDHTVVGPLLARGTTDRPVVATNHGPFGALTAVYRAVADQVAVVAISGHQASTAGDLPIAAVIHHGIEVGQVPEGDGRGGYVAFLGRMHPDKGVALAIRAARRAGLPLRIAAKMREPGERSYYEQQIAPLLGSDVEYLGELSRTDKLQLLGGAICLLNPVQWAEPFGMVMIEALACGTPVVATPCGSAPEIIEPGITGLLAVTATELATAVQDASRFDRQTCRSVAAHRFSAERMVADHVALYRSLLEHADRPVVDRSDGPRPSLERLEVV